MKTLATDAKAAIVRGDALVTGAVRITPRDAGDEIFVWGGFGVLTVTLDDGDQDFLPLGDRAFAQQNAQSIGAVSQGMTLILSGVEPSALELLDVEDVKAASVTIYRCIFASDGQTLLDFHVFDRGHGDALDTLETIGGQAVIQYSVESAARALGRGGARTCSDNDQRLINPDDGYFKNTAYAGSKVLYWGGKKPATIGDSLSPPNGNFG